MSWWNVLYFFIHKRNRWHLYYPPETTKKCAKEGTFHIFSHSTRENHHFPNGCLIKTLHAECKRYVNIVPCKNCIKSLTLSGVKDSLLSRLVKHRLITVKKRKQVMRNCTVIRPTVVLQTREFSSAQLKYHDTYVIN